MRRAGWPGGMCYPGITLVWRALAILPWPPMICRKKLMYYLLFYDYVDNILERRKPYRAGHLALTQEYVDRGELLLGGAYAEPADGAALVFKVDDKARIEAFVERDPYVVNGLVTAWRIRAWNVVVGAVF